MRGARIHDVAREAGVSVATVSRVVRDYPDVSEETRQRVQAVIARLGYRPSPLARALVSGRSQLIALLVSDITNPFYPELAKSVERHAGRAGYGLVICNTDDDPLVTRDHVQRLLDHGIEGIIHASAGPDEAEVGVAAIGDTSVIFVNRRPVGVGANYVVSDNVAGGRALARHLLDLGCQTIGFISGPSFATNGRDRLRGLEETVRDHGAGSRILVEAGDFSPESGQAAVETWLKLGALPDAVVGVNDRVAIGAMNALLAANIRVPEDIAVAGFDDIAPSSSRLIGLTCIAQQTDRMGERAVAGLLRLRRRRSSGGTRPIREVLSTQLVIRTSTAGRLPKPIVVPPLARAASR